MDKVLNQHEIDEMVRAARSGGASLSKNAGPVVQRWDIRQAGQIGADQLRAINQLHEGFARNLTTSIGGYLRIVFDCALVSAEHLTYREFLQRIADGAYVASCELLPFGSVAILQLDLAIAFPLIDVMMGGEGKAGQPARDLTEIERQILEGVMRIICRDLQSTWHAINLVVNFETSQQVSQAQRLMAPDEKNLCLSFEIKMSETRGTLNVAVPALVSNALLRKISADISYHQRQSPVEARQQIQEKLLDCPFSMELATPRLQVLVEDLSRLAPGSLLAFSRSASAPAVLHVEGVPLSSAAPVRMGVRRAARILALEANVIP